MTLYIYTYLQPDGQDFINGPRTKMDLAELQAVVGGYIQIVPKDYYKHHNWQPCTVYVNEDGRFTDSHAPINPNFRDMGNGYNIVGTALKEQVYHGSR